MSAAQLLSPVPPIIDPACLITFPNFAIAAGRTSHGLCRGGQHLGRDREGAGFDRPIQHDFAADRFHQQQQESDHRFRHRRFRFRRTRFQSSTGTGIHQQRALAADEHRVQESRAPARGRAADQFGERSLTRYSAEARQCGRHRPRVDGNDIPNIATRYIRTTVSAPNGSTIVLGGLIQDEKQRTRTGFPILDRLPLIGALFSDTVKTKMRTELIVLMRPEVTLTKLDSLPPARKDRKTKHISDRNWNRTTARIVRRLSMENSCRRPICRRESKHKSAL